MNTHSDIIDEAIRDPFRRQFGIAREPERPIDEPERPATDLNLAIKRLRTSLTAGKASKHWKSFQAYIDNEIDSAFIEQLMLSFSDDEALVLHTLMKPIWDKALTKTANEFIDELGVVES